MTIPSSRGHPPSRRGSLSDAARRLEGGRMDRLRMTRPLQAMCEAPRHVVTDGVSLVVSVITTTDASLSTGTPRSDRPSNAPSPATRTVDPACDLRPNDSASPTWTRSGAAEPAKSAEWPRTLMSPGSDERSSWRGRSPTSTRAGCHSRTAEAAHAFAAADRALPAAACQPASTPTTRTCRSGANTIPSHSSNRAIRNTSSTEATAGRRSCGAGGSRSRRAPLRVPGAVACGHGPEAVRRRSRRR